MDEFELLATVAAVRAGRLPPAALVSMLPEHAAASAGVGAGEVRRRRGWILAAFEHAGLPPAALPYVVEELETARDAYVCAAAAKALRGWTMSEPSFAQPLATAFINMQWRDDAVCFDDFRPDWSTAVVTTPLLELLATLRWHGHLPKPVADDLSAVAEQGSELSRTVRAALTDLLQTLPDDGPHKPCCHAAPPVTETAIPEVSPAALRGVVVEDQNGERSAVVDALSGRPTVLAFFYTRCDNPYKCSLTVTKMARLQQRLRDTGRADAIGLALVSYDPEYDTPPRLSRYAAARGFIPSPEHRLFRAAEGHDQLRAAFALRVGYDRTLVNRHGLEVHVTGPDARIARTWARVAWDIDEVSATALALL